MTQVIIPSAGLGSRLGTITRNINKALIPVGMKPAISYIIDWYPENFTFIIAVGYKGDYIKDYIKIAYPKRKFIFVDVKPFEGEGSGLGYTLKCCNKYIKEDFFFHTNDGIILDKINFSSIKSDTVFLSNYRVNPLKYRTVVSKGKYISKFIDKTPKKIPLAKKINKISYEEMLELSSLGTKVMQSSAVQTAMMYDIPLQVRSTFTDRKGTEIFSKESIDYSKSVTGVAYSKDDAKITLIGVEDKPGVAADIFEPLGKKQINVDMVIQNISSDGKTTDLTFTIKREDLTKTLNILKDNNRIKFKELNSNDKVSKVSIVGAGMVTAPGVTYKMFRALAEVNINILAISTSEIKISVIINEVDTLNAVKKLHTIFDLD